MTSRFLVIAFLVLSLASCGDAGPPAPPTWEEHLAEFPARTEHTDERVEVQHVLISFAGTPRTKATRSREEAEALAKELYERIQAGEEFDALVKEYTDDSYPGIYVMSLNGGSPMGPVYQRKGMVGAFGDTGWRLAVGEVGVAPYDPNSSPFGYHIVKRLN